MVVLYVCLSFLVGAVTGLNLSVPIVAWCQARQRENKAFEAHEANCAEGQS